MDEFKNVRMLKDIGADHKANETYKLDADTANKWITAGLGEEVVASPEDALVDRLSKAMEERDEKLVASISKAVRISGGALSRVPAVAKDNDPGSVAELLQCVKTLDKSSSSHDEKQAAHNLMAEKYRAKASQVTTSGEYGGHLVSTEFSSQFLSFNPYSEVVRPRATRIPVATGEIEIPSLDQSMGFRSTMSAFWEGEIDAAQETNVKFTQKRLKPKRVAAYVPVSNKLLATSAVSVDAIIRKLFNDQLAYKFDSAFLNGDGVGKPLGILDPAATATLYVDRQADNEVKFADTVQMFASLPANTRGNAVWVISQTVLPKLMSMETTAGYLAWVPNANAAPSMVLHGLPVLVSESSPVLGATGDIILADFSNYYVGELQNISISVSTEVRFLQSETVFKVEAWLDGQPALDHKLLLGDGSTYVSPFIALEEHSS